MSSINDIRDLLKRFKEIEYKEDNIGYVLIR